MYSQQTVVFVHVAAKCSYWNKCSVCVSILLPYKSALPTAAVWNADNLLHNTHQPFYHPEASVSNLREHAEVQIFCGFIRGFSCSPHSSTLAQALSPGRKGGNNTTKAWR
jgi:hypothetical protein